MKRTVFIFFLLASYCNCVFGQENNSIIDHTVEYSSSEGYNISNPFSAVYDHLGWLWIVGDNLQKNQFILGANDLIIQRFDGTNFHELSFPNPENKALYGYFIKNGTKGLLFHAIYRDKPPELYSINCETLEFTLIKDFSKIIKQHVYANHLVLNNKLLFIFKNQNEVFSYELIDEKFQLLDSVKKDNIDVVLSPAFTSNKGKYTVLNLGAQFYYLMNDQGKFLKKLTLKDFVFKNDKTPLPPLMYYGFGKKNDSAHFFYGVEKGFLKLDPVSKKFIELDSIDFLKNKIIPWWGSTDNQFLVVDKKQFDYYLQFYTLKSNKVFLKGNVDIGGFAAMASRDLDKEIVILYGNTIKHLHFNQHEIKTFLKGQSIRAIKEISEDNYIVATDDKGFYEINTRTNEEKKIHFIDKGEEFQIIHPRDIFKVDSFYFFNDKYYLFKVDKDYNIVKKYVHDNTFEEVQKIGDTIFKTGLYYPGIIKFSIKGETYTKIEGSEIQQCRELIAKGKKLYGITLTGGVVEYEKGILKYYTTKKEKSENFLSITNDPNYGILVSTNHGKLYQFDTIEKTFDLFYEDKINASIVGVVSDTAKVVWMNTYAGIVSYNPDSKKVKRYTKKDGIYELEGNRYSTYKDSKDNLFMGSFKGLSFFNPHKIHTKEKKVALQFTSISFFDTEKGIWESKENPSYLNALKEIVLPSYNQRFSAKVSILDIVKYKNYNFRYRLVEDSTEDNNQWNRLNLENDILFSNLSAGTYTLQVEILNSVNERIGEPLEINIISKQIFYKTWWFVLIVLLIIIAFFSYLFLQFKSKQKLLMDNEIAINEAKVKEVMMLEIHHRIKNNLQVVSGLLSLQAFNSSDTELQSKLKDSQGRIDSIAGIHNILYKNDSQESVEVEDYFNDIISYNKTLFPIHVSYDMEITETKLYMDKAIPLALILNELISNSHKHAFGGIKHPKISVIFKEEGSMYTFIYADNGTFKNKTEDRVSMGMKIISMMSIQLKGNYSTQEKNNFTLELTFPKEE